MDNCVFCKIIANEIPGRIIYQDDFMVAFHDIAPKADIHVLAVSKIHLKNLANAEASHSELLSHMLLTLPKIANSLGLTSGFRTIINTGPGGGQEIDHFHIHILGGKSLPGF